MRSTTPRILTVVAMVTAVTLATAGAAFGDSRAPIQVPPVGAWPGAPTPYAAFDWKQRAIDYDTFVYDWSQPGSCSTIQTDTTHHHMPTNTYKMPTYYCDTSQLGAVDGQQEAWNQVASVVGASLVGIDKSNQGGYDYVDMNRTFFDPSLGVAVDKPDVPSTNVFASSYAYVGLTNVLYYMMGAQYPDATDMTTMLRSIADTYYDQIVILGGADADFVGGGFDFSAMQAIDNGPGDLEGGEGAIAAAMIFTWAYAKFGDAKYLTAAKWAMNYVEKTSPSLFYEVTGQFAPYIAARLNATQGTDYDVSKAFANVLGGSVTRGGWGTMYEPWNGYDVHGLIGSQTNGGGYAFAMNSFMTGMFSSTVKYDTRYADTVGRWLLNVSNAARFFYPDQMPADKQFYGSTYISDPAHVIPYEGLRASEGGKSPSATGDPWRYGAGWGLSPTATNLSLYSGSSVGFLGGILTPTNVAGINRIDLNKLDFFSAPAYPEYLYYNPGSSAATVQLAIGSTAKQVYDAVSDTVLYASASGTQNVTVPAGGSAVIVLTPANAAPVVVDGNTVVNGVTVRYGTESADLAYRAPVAVSSTKNGNVGSNLTDGLSTTRWESQASDPQAFFVDLGARMTVSSVRLDWETASAKSFRVEVSDDGSTWTPVYSTVGGPGGQQKIDFTPVQARYVQVYMTQRNTQWAYSLWGFHVYDDNLAQSRPVTVSSTKNGNQAVNLVDNNSATRWESQASDPQSFTVDLGAAQTVDTVNLNWETAAAKSFTVGVSADGANWSSVYSTTAGPGGNQVITFSPKTAKYVRVTMTERKTTFAYSLWDVGVYNTDLAITTPVVVSSTSHGLIGANLTDGSHTTRWESQASDPQWFSVDLGAARTVGSVALDWETAAAQSFQVALSTDGTTWSNVFTTTAGPCPPATTACGVQHIAFTPASARYVRVTMTQRATQWAYSLWGFEVHAK